MKKNEEFFFRRLTLNKILRKMKVTIILLLIGIMSSYAELYSRDAPISIDMQNGNLSDLFQIIEHNSEYKVYYKTSLIDETQTVNLTTDEMPVSEILALALADQNLTFDLSDKVIIITSAKEKANQPQTVTGTVTDGSTGEPLPGVTVQVKGILTGAITQVDGTYSVVISPDADTLIFSFVGYATEEIPINGRLVIDVVMEEEVTALEEVVVIGYGTQQRREISGSVTNVTPRSFNPGVTRTAIDLLQGRVAGLIITQASGDVTIQQSVRLRGQTSLTGSSEPFVVIDGIPGMDLNAIAPQDIKSISVLKDASAAAIYGSRSGSGVILITTKSGISNQSTIDYNGYVAFDVVMNKPDVLTAAEWRKYTADNGINTEGLDLGADTDWFGEIMRTGITHNHDLSYTGGGTNNSYRASVSYQQREGVVKDNYQERLNTRLTFTQKALNDRLNVTLTGSMNMRKYQPTETRNFVLSYNMIPVAPVKFDDGTWFDSLEYDQGNPVRNIEYNKRLNKNNIYYVNLKADLNIFRGLNAGINVLREGKTTDNALYNHSETEQGRNDQGFAQRTSSNSDRRLLETTINYVNTFNVHKVTVLGGYSYEDNYSKNFRAQNRLFVTDLLGYDDLASGENLLTGDVTSGGSMYKLISFFGRINYSLLERYIITATVRRDGSSKFGKNNKWGTFPSASVAWRLSDEPFMRYLNFLSELKLRVGYGVAGNQDGISPYNSMELYGSSGVYYDEGDWHTAYVVSQNANPDLKWEQTAMFNIGLDYSIMQGRLNGTFEYYDKRTSDLLYNYSVPVPPYLYSSMLANVGIMQNKGIEILINGDIIRNPNMRWNVSVNLAHNKNEILSLSSEEFTTTSIKTGNAWVRGGSYNTTHIVEEGKQVGQFYGWSCTGLDADGLYIMDDMVDGEPGLTDDDRTYIGKAQPKLTYGITNSFTYKNFELSFFLRGVYGGDVLNYSKMSYATTQWLPGANVLYDALTIGLEENPKYNSFYLDKGSYLRMQNLSIAYNLNTNVLGFNSFRFYFTGQNLLTITKYKGVDPEISMSGLDPGVEGRNYYPKSRTYTFGVNVSF